MHDGTIFSHDTCRRILQFVRAVIIAKANHNSPPEFEEPPDKLLEQGACFVTLHDSNNHLRGCIGNIVAIEPLEQNLAHNAANAAFNDPRFPPVEANEIGDLIIEVSILTPIKTIASPEEFVVGKHGIILKCRGRSAVFLPQVAPEQGWNRETTFFHLCLKAGLPSEAWRGADASFSVFEAIVFSEKDYAD